jgi:hypothetical protein
MRRSIYLKENDAWLFSNLDREISQELDKLYYILSKPIGDRDWISCIALDYR